MNISSAIHRRQRVAVVGAGISGLSCARVLAESGCEVTVFDKGRKAGGRVSTRSTVIDGTTYAFDYGAQYFTARHPDFRVLVEQWEQKGIASRWSLAGPDAWVGVPGMATVVETLAEGLDVRWAVNASAVTRQDAGWVVHGGDGLLFDTLVLAMPAEQAAVLAATHDFVLARRAATSRSEPCWTLMLALSEILPASHDIITDDPDIPWVARNSAKPGRPESEAWVIQASANWSAAHLECPAKEVADILTGKFADLLGASVAPVFARAHRWRYALSQAGNDGLYWNGTLDLGACGDWLLAPRIESAWISGKMLAQRVLRGQLGKSNINSEKSLFSHR